MHQQHIATTPRSNTLNLSNHSDQSTNTKQSSTLSHTQTPSENQHQNIQNLSLPSTSTTGQQQQQQIATTTNLFPNNVFPPNNTNNSNNNNNVNSSNDSLQIHSSQPLIPSTPPNPFSVGFIYSPSPKFSGINGSVPVINNRNSNNPQTPPNMNLNMMASSQHSNIDSQERWNDTEFTSGHEEIIGAWQTMFNSNLPNTNSQSSLNGSPGFQFNPHGICK